MPGKFAEWLVSARGSSDARAARAALALFFLVRTIRSLIRTTRSSVVLAVPLAAEQAVDFPKDERHLLLNIEGRMLQRGLGDLRYELVSTASGIPVAMSRILMRTTVRSGTRARLSVYSLASLRAGRYVLRVQGIGPAGEPEGARILFTHPIGAALATHVIGIVFFAALVVGSMVAAGLAIAKR